MANDTKEIIGIAPDDPFDKKTFSGLSVNLFGEMQNQGVLVHPVATRDIRWHDVFRGAIHPRGLTRDSSRQVSRISPDWAWSRATLELMTRRLSARLKSVPRSSAIFQVGTHVRTDEVGIPAYCITDCTIAQALEVGRTYLVGRAKRSVQQEALDWQREVFAGCSKIFVLSEWVERSVVNDYGIPANRVVVVGAGANVPRNLPARNRNAEAPAILFVGLDWEQKGGPLLLDAFRGVRKIIPRARLQIIGCRPPGLEAEPGVEVLGRLNRALPEEESRLLRAYAEASCFCIVPLVDAFPNVLLEAGAFGLPVVSTDVGSRREVVIDRVTGRLVPHDDAPALAQALVEVLSDPNAAEEYGAAASRQVAERFSWARVVRTMLQAMNLQS